MVHKRIMMGLLALLLVGMLLAGWVNLPQPAQAAPLAQGGMLSFTDPLPASGTLDSATPQVTYSFACTETGVASVAAETTAGDLEIEILVQAPGGRLLAQGGVLSRNPNRSVAEAFEMPLDGTCTVTLRRLGATAGSYEVRLLPGFAQLDKLDFFDGSESPLAMYWEPYASDSMTVARVGQRLQIQVFTDNLLGYAVPTGDDLKWTDLYIQADFEIVGSPSYAEYGFVLRLHDEEDLFYTVTFSQDNDWSVYWFNGEWTAIQEWTVSDVIDGADKTPTIGVWLQGDTFRAYFNGKLVGEVSDAQRYAAEGNVAVVGATGVDQTDPLTVFADNLVITVPARGAATGLPFGGQSAEPTPAPTPGGLFGMLGAKPTPTQEVVIPPTPTPPQLFVPSVTPPVIIPASPTPVTGGSGRLTSWDSGSPKQIVAELRALGLVPAGGAVAVTVPSSYDDTSQSGFRFHPLAQGRRFRNFVLAFDARLVNTGPESGCGMYFRDDGMTNQDALVFEDGYFLLGEWDIEGSLMDNSFYEPSDAVIPGQGATNHVIVVAIEGDVTMFVNGQQVAEAQFTPQTGELALEMYVHEDDAGNTVQTYCQLNDIWLWEF